MTRRDFARLAAACACGPAVYAQTSERKASELKAKDLIDKTIYALGGDAFRNLPHRIENGRAFSFYHEQLSGLSVARIYTKYLPAESSAPVKMVQRQVFGKKLDEAVIFGENDAYDVTFRGAAPLPPDRLEQFRNSALRDVFYILRQRLTEPGLSMDATGADVVDNQSTEKIEFYDSENRAVTVWISATTFLPVRQRFDRWDPVIKERRMETTNFTTYRDCGDGVTLPWTTERERDGERIFQMYADHVTVTQPVADNLFELPPNVRILSK